MFDYLRFGYVMPDGYKATSLQTKDLDQELELFEVTQTGRLMRMTSIDQAQRPVGDTNHSGMVRVRPDSGYGAGAKYGLEFVDGQLVAIHSQRHGRLIFDPSQWSDR